jgi:hypothetical protein
MALHENPHNLVFYLKGHQKTFSIGMFGPHVTLVEMEFVRALPNLVVMLSTMYSWGDTPWPSYNSNLVPMY